MRANEEKAKAYAEQYEGRYQVAMFKAFIDGATEMEQNPSDALIMRILNCIGYEDESWIEFVKNELEKRKEK